MADIDSKNKDTADGFDFDGMDWGSEDTSSSASSGSATTSAGGDDPFSPAGDDDDGFGGGDSFYSLEQMPDADSSDAFSDLGGGDDFGDIKTDDEPVSYDFGSDDDDLPQGRKITDDASGFDAPEDPFASDDAYAAQQDDETVDPFAVPDEADDAATEEQPAAADKPKSKLVTYVMAAAAAVIAIGGVVYVAPSFIGGAPQQVAEVQPVQDDAPPFPSSLPPQDIAPPEVIAPEVAQVAPPAVEPVLALPSAEAPAEAPPALTLPDLQAPAAPQQPTPEAPVAQAPANDPFKDLVGGKERGGIDAMKDAEPAAPAAPSVHASEVAALAARLEALEGRVETLADSFDNFVEASIKTAQAAPAAVTSPAEQPEPGKIVPPMKPPIIEGVSLKGVAGDVAWISTKSGVVEVKVGDEIPNGGKVVTFRNYRGDWIVVTTDGLVVRQ